MVECVPLLKAGGVAESTTHKRIPLAHENRRLTPPLPLHAEKEGAANAQGRRGWVQVNGT